MQVLEHKELEKLYEIKRENEILLKKLMEVSKGKQIGVPQHVVSGAKNTKLLHIERKKVEAERIDEANLKLLTKITNVKPTLAKSKMDEEFRRY